MIRAIELTLQMRARVAASGSEVEGVDMVGIKMGSVVGEERRWKKRKTE